MLLQFIKKWKVNPLNANINLKLQLAQIMSKSLHPVFVIIFKLWKLIKLCGVL